METDIIVYLAVSYLDDYDKIQLMMITKKYYSLRFKFTFNNKVKYSLVEYLSYYDSFTNLIINNNDLILPKKIKYLTFGENFNQSIKGCIPNSVTHLTFDWKFDQSIEGCIPNSVTHLTFGRNFDQPIEGCIPKSVTYLSFGRNFNQPIEVCIPNSVTAPRLALCTKYRGVTHLTFGYIFNQSIKDCIPNSVTAPRLALCTLYRGVTHLTFYGDNKRELYENDIPKSIKNIMYKW